MPKQWMSGDDCDGLVLVLTEKNGEAVNGSQKLGPVVLAGIGVLVLAVLYVVFGR